MYLRGGPLQGQGDGKRGALLRRALHFDLPAVRFNDAAGSLYRFVWNQFCDWYLELVKPVFSGDDAVAKAEAQACTAYVLEETYKLLHPFMPFMTEELWTHTAGEGRERDTLLCQAAWPSPAYADDADPQRREAVLRRVIDDWRDLAHRAKERGLGFLMWEHMSIRREFGHTLPETRRIQALVEEDMPLPFKICADIDHGDVTSQDPRDYDPYAIAEALAADSPVIHIKQSSMDKGGHRPFTPENNAKYATMATEEEMPDPMQNVSQRLAEFRFNPVSGTRNRDCRRPTSLCKPATTSTGRPFAED